MQHRYLDGAARAIEQYGKAQQDEQARYDDVPALLQIAKRKSVELAPMEADERRKDLLKPGKSAFSMR